jgi:hypothetical protein
MRRGLLAASASAGRARTPHEAPSVDRTDCVSQGIVAESKNINLLLLMPLPAANIGWPRALFSAYGRRRNASRNLRSFLPLSALRLADLIIWCTLSLERPKERPMSAQDSPAKCRAQILASRSLCNKIFDAVSMVAPFQDFRFCHFCCLSCCLPVRPPTKVGWYLLHHEQCRTD